MGRPGGATLAALRAAAAVAILVLAATPAHADVLRFVEVHRDGVAGVDSLYGARAVAVSPDGAHVYVVAQADDAVAIFARAGDGRLSYVGAVVDGVGGVTGLRVGTAIAISPDGAHVYVGADADSSLAVFARDPGTGALAFVEAEFDGQGGVEDMLAPRGVTVSPDGTHVYVASIFSGGLARFARDAGTGAVTYLGTTVDETNGPSSLAVTEDGLDVYVASQGAGVTHFARDPSSGDLAFVGLQAPDLYTWRRPRIVALSPDQQNVYASSLADASVAAFDRDETTGELALIDFYAHDQHGILGLERANWVTVSPDGQWVFALGEFSDSLTVFRRAADGSLMLEEEHFELDPGVEGLDFPLSIATSPDGRDLYVAADHGGGSVAHFAVPAPSAGSASLAALLALGALGVRGRGRSRTASG